MPAKAYSGEAKIFSNGGSQAVRLPAECRFESSTVQIQKLGDHVIISPKGKNWDAFFARPRLAKKGRIKRGKQEKYEKREGFK